MFGLNPSVLEPVKPGNNTKAVAHTVRGEWEHESYWEDADFDSEDYAYRSIKEEA